MGKFIDNCKPKFKARNLGKLGTDSIAYFHKIRKVDGCKIFGLANSEGDLLEIRYSHATSDKPDERICGIEKCDMTGTLILKTKQLTAPFGESITEVMANSEELQYGYIRFMIYGAKDDNFSVAIRNSTNAGENKYDVTLSEDGWNAIILELFNPDTVVSGGWIANNSSFKFAVKPLQAGQFKVSTLELFDDINELVNYQTFGFTCISDFSGDPAFTITEDLCDIPVYDEMATTMERSLTATQLIGDLTDFSSIARKQKASQHLVQVRSEFTAKLETLNGIQYSVFEIPELADISCPRLMIQPQDCEFESLKHVNIDNDSTTVSINEEFFFRRGKKIYLHHTNEDKKIMVAYPIWIDGVGYDITSEELNKQRYMMELVVPFGDSEYIIKADNVLMTALPLTWTSEAGSFTVPYTMAKDSYGRFGQIIKVDGRK